MKKFLYLFFLLLLIFGNSFGQFQNNDPRIFNVLLWGAKGDGVTDDTGPIQKAINAAAKVSGTVYFPYTKHHYIVNGAILTNDGQGDSVNNAQLYIPYISLSNRAQMGYITIKGENPPNTYTDYSAAVSQIPDSTVIIESTSTSSTGAVFGGAYLNGTWGNFGYLQADFENLCIRVHSKTGASHIATKMTAIDASVLAMFAARHVRLDTQSPQDSSVSPASTSYGIKTPALNNFAYVELEDLLIQNYYCGILANEHTNSRGAITIATCHYGIITQSSYHAINFNRLLLIWNIANIALYSGAQPVTMNVSQLDLEDYPGFTASGGALPDRWFNILYDIKDSSGGGARGQFMYQRVIAGAGIDQGIITIGIGGSSNININVSPIGYPPHIFNDAFTTGVSTTLEVAGVGQYTGILFNNGHSSNLGGNYIKFQKGGIDKYQYGNDFLANNTNDLYFYDYSHSRLFQYYTSGGVNQFGGTDASATPLFTVSSTNVTLPVLTATALDTTNYKMVVRKSSDNSLAVMNWEKTTIVIQDEKQKTITNIASETPVSDTVTLPLALDTFTVWRIKAYFKISGGGTNAGSADVIRMNFKAGSAAAQGTTLASWTSTQVGSTSEVCGTVNISYSTSNGWQFEFRSDNIVGVGSALPSQVTTSFNDQAVSGSFDPTATQPTIWWTYTQATQSNTKSATFDHMTIEQLHR